MPESPCQGCGQLTLHTDDDSLPTCELCTEKLMWLGIIVDIAEGRIKVKYDDDGRPIVPGVPTPK